MSTINSEKEKDLETFFPEGKKIVIYDKDLKQNVTFVIEELLIGTRVVFIKTFVSIFKDIAEQRPEIKQANDIQAVLALIEIGGDKIVDIYCSLLNKPEEWVRRNLTTKKEVELILAFFEVNDIPFLISQVRRMLPEGLKA